MSETVVARTLTRTESSAASLLVGAGVTGLAAAGLAGVAAFQGARRLCTVVGELVVDMETPISSESELGRYIAAAREARERVRSRLAPTGPANVGSADTSEMLARAEALAEAFRSTPALALVAEATSDLEACFRNVEAARELFAQRAYAQSNAMAARAEASLLAAAEASHERLAHAQRRVVADMAQRSLHSLGYDVERAEGSQATALRAADGDKLLALVVTDGGQLLVETAGYGGAGCAPAMAAFFRRMREEGIQVDPDARHRHELVGGGPLIEGHSESAGAILRAANQLKQRASKSRRKPNRGNGARSRMRQRLWAKPQDVVTR